MPNLNENLEGGKMQRWIDKPGVFSKIDRRKYFADKLFINKLLRFLTITYIDIHFQ